MTDFKELIAGALEQVLDGKLKKEEISALLEVPPTPEMGDYAFPCFKLAGLLKKKPNKIAFELAEKIFLPNGIAGMNPNGPYLNFFAAKEFGAIAKKYDITAATLEIILSKIGN